MCTFGICNGAIGVVQLYDKRDHGGAALCAVFAGLLFRGYKIKEKNER